MAAETYLFPQGELSEALLQKYNTHGPRYTSYPTVPAWRESFGPQEYQAAIIETNQPESERLPLSLYVHIPFCRSLCLYCSCNMVVTQQQEQAEKYLSYLFREIEHVAGLIQPGREVVQMHWGGGTPTYLTPEQMERLFRFQAKHFTIAQDAEIALEVDPRTTSSEQLHVLRALGFNRISMGLQDFDPLVQQTVNRIQPVEMTENLIQEAKSLGFGSINLDLIYGLPFQTVETFRKTLAEVIRIGPDRVALYNYAYVPWISHHQKRLPADKLPPGEEKFRIFQAAMQAFTDAGYIYIGMDHFAKPQDELSIALSEGRLHRNFMGYTVQGAPDNVDAELYGFGSSAISGLSRFYAQNRKKLSRYYEGIDHGELPIHRGMALTLEDVLRRQVILAVLCQGRVRFSAIEQAFGVDFRQHFAEALTRLEGPAEDGLLVWQPDGLALTPLGRIFSRNIAMAFDAYLPTQAEQAKQPIFSKTL